jgi:hypothetical protein
VIWTPPPIPDDLRVMSEVAPSKCARAADVLRRAIIDVTPNLRTLAPDLSGVRFQRIGLEATIQGDEHGSAIVTAGFARGGDDVEWDHARVSMHPLALGLPLHPLAPTTRRTSTPMEAVLLFRAACERAAALLDVAADPERGMPATLVPTLRRRLMGVAAHAAFQDLGPSAGFDAAWTSHEGPIRAVRYFGGEAIDLLSDTDRTGWTDGLPPVMGVALRGAMIVLRPMVLTSGQVPDGPIDRMRLIAGMQE